MLSQNLDNFSNATAIPATSAIPDLFTLEKSPKTKNPTPVVADSLSMVIHVLHNHVGWAERPNRIDSRFITFGWCGCNLSVEQEFYFESVHEPSELSFVASSMLNVVNNFEMRNNHE